MFGPLRFYPPYINGLVVHTPFFFSLFFSLIIAWNWCWQFFFLSNFWAKKAGFIEKSVILLSGGRGGGVSLPTPLVVRPFFSGRITKVLPSLHLWLSGPYPLFFSLFFSLIITCNWFWQFFFLSNFWAEKAGFIEKSVILLSGGGGGLASLHP